MSFIEIKDITHCFSSAPALDHVNLKIESGEFFSLLGPSGCGKSTLLNIIGGFLNPTGGHVLVDGNDITDLASHHRQIGMVFQSYALFPHLNVFDNIAYGLKIKKLKKAEIKERVGECLELVHLEAFADRMPHHLSGGQQQRVAIARALAIRPSILMLDEPLGNLDALLRKEMQVELRTLQKRVGITTIMVTHDQEEAMSLSDRIGILRNGRVQQVGTPIDIYRRPVNEFVAGFLGQVNLTHVVQNENSPNLFRSTEWFHSNDAPVELLLAPENVKSIDGGGLVMLRPERIHVSFCQQDISPNHVNAIIRSITYVGHAVYLTIAFDGGGELNLNVPDPLFIDPPKINQQVHVSWTPEDLLMVSEEEK